MEILARTSLSRVLFHVMLRTFQKQRISKASSFLFCFVCLFVYLFVCLFVCFLFVCLFFFLFVLSFLLIVYASEPYEFWEDESIDETWFNGRRDVCEKKKIGCLFWFELFISILSECAISDIKVVIGYTKKYYRMLIVRSYNVNIPLNSSCPLPNKAMLPNSTIYCRLCNMQFKTIQQCITII